MHFSATDLEIEIEAVITALAKEAAACTQSPPAPDSTGWGAPDWRDGRDYPAPDELDDLEWRWEFLRRNHGYRRDWLRAADEYLPCPKNRYFEEAYGLYGPMDPRHSIRSMPGFVSNAKSQAKPIVKYRSSGRAPFIEVLLSKRFAEFWDLERIIQRPPHFADIYVRYDLSRPIEPQVAEIKSLLMQLRREAFGPNVDRVRQKRARWPLHLRLLDAADEGASYGDMASILRTGSRTGKSARDLLKAAERLRQAWRH